MKKVNGYNDLYLRIKENKGKQTRQNQLYGELLLNKIKKHIEVSSAELETTRGLAITAITCLTSPNWCFPPRYLFVALQGIL